MNTQIDHNLVRQGVVIGILALLALFAGLVLVDTASALLPGYDESITYTVTANDNLPNDYTIFLNVTHQFGMDDNFNDVRFTKLDDTELDYWIESFEISRKAFYWVEMDESLSSNENYTIVMQWSSITAGASSTSSLIDTFINTADFDDGLGSNWYQTAYPVYTSDSSFPRSQPYNMRIGYLGDSGTAEWGVPIVDEDKAMVFYINQDNPNYFLLLGGDGVNTIQVLWEGGSSNQLYYYNGATWVNIGKFSSDVSRYEKMVIQNINISTGTFDIVMGDEEQERFKAGLNTNSAYANIIDVVSNRHGDYLRLDDIHHRHYVSNPPTITEGPGPSPTPTPTPSGNVTLDQIAETQNMLISYILLSLILIMLILVLLLTHIHNDDLEGELYD